MISLLQWFKRPMNFLWCRTYLKHNRIPVIYHICIFVTFITYLCKRLNRRRHRNAVSVNNTNICLLYAVRIAQNIIFTMAFGTRPLCMSCLNSLTSLAFLYLFREFIPDFSFLISERIYSNTCCAYKWLYKSRTPLSSCGRSWYANIFFRKMGLMFFTHPNISITMVFIRDT